jgi:ABC-type glycerol-3-phosphate transport system permease component
MIRRLTDLACYAILAGAAFVALFPLFWTVSTSVKMRNDTFTLPPKLLSFGPTAKNYAAIAEARGFGVILWNTILITAASTLVCVTVATLAAYALARAPQFRGRRTLEVGMILIRAIPAVVIMVPLFSIASALGAYDSHAALILMYAAVNLPFAVWLMTSFIEQVPVALEDSAAVDGATRAQVLWFVLLPVILPGLAATTIFVALLAWNEFLIPVMLAGSGAKTLPVYIAGFISARNLDWGPMAAAATIAILPIAVLTVAAQRWLIAGLSAGALKG